jgi:GR25 family glycosyltransferase involved in LPS biosynthesis
MQPVVRSIILITLLSILFLVLFQRRKTMSPFVPGNGWMNTHFHTVYVISSAENKSYISDIMSDLEVTPDYVKRVDPQGLKRAELIEDQVITEECTLPMQAIASNMSHLLALNAFLENEEANTAFIFEDDIKNVDDLAALKTSIEQVMTNVPNDWDVINFGRCLDKCAANIEVSANLRASTGALCRFAYAVSREGAEKIVEFTTTMKSAVQGDEVIAAYALAGKLKMYVPDKALFVQNLVDQNNKHKQECVDLEIKN